MSSTGTQKTDISRFVRDNEQLHGIYRGVVEDRNDPLRLGRVRVRIWGVHTEEQEGDLNQAPWEELVWAHPILSNFSGSISDCGGWYIPLQGSHVMVFFENGNMMQPRYFGTVPGYPIDGAKYSQLEKQDGYIDPDEEYPLTDHIEEHDWHRLARVMNLDKTYLSIKEANLDEAVPIAFGGEWDEQPPMYETEYPHGNVWATEEEFDKNQVFELDGTPGAQRLQYWHPSMSYFEINKDGRMVIRNKLHRWDICDGMVHLHYMSLYHKTVSDTMTFLLEKSEFREIMEARWTRIHDTDWRNVKSDSWEHLEVNEIVQIGNNRDEIVGNNETFEIGGNKYHTVDGDYKEITLGSKESVIEADMKKWITGNYEKNVDGDYKHAVYGFREVLVGTGHDDLFVSGKKRIEVEEIYHTYSGDDFVVNSGTNVSLNAAGGEIVVFGLGGAYIESPATAKLVGGTAGVNAMGSIVTVGPTVQLGVAPGAIVAPYPSESPIVPSPAKPAAPPTPVDPPDPPDPPDPHIPPEFPPPEIIIKMPEPAC